MAYLLHSEKLLNIFIVIFISAFIIFMLVFGKMNMMKENKFYKEDFEYLKTPNYNLYLDVVKQNLKNEPYYTFNKEQLHIPMFYNYLLPNIPTIDMSSCPSNNILQYWYTTQ